MKVGDGRGFVLKRREDFRLPHFMKGRLIVTAAHCLPKLPPAHRASYLHERTYANLLGPLNGKRNIWAECVFVDPIADIAVLGSPDNQELSEEAEAYDALIDKTPVLRSPRSETGKDGSLLSTAAVGFRRSWI